MLPSKIISIIGCTLLAGTAVAAPVVASQFEGMLDDLFDTTNRNFDGEEFKQAAVAMPFIEIARVGSGVGFAARTETFDIGDVGSFDGGKGVGERSFGDDGA